MRWAGIGMGLLLAACAEPPGPVGGDDTGDLPTDTGGDEVVDTDDDPVAPCSSVMNLEVVPLDIWGRDLQASLWVDPSLEAVDDPGAGPSVRLYRLGSEPAELFVEVDAPDLEAAQLEVAWGGPQGGFEVGTPTGTARAVAGHAKRSLGGVECPVFTVLVGLDHPRFAASGRPPTPNAFELHLDGEVHWAAVYDELVQARERVTWTTWWWESDFELVRPPGHATMSETQREHYTAMYALDALPGVERRVLVNRFWGENTDFAQYVNTDGPLRDRAEAGGDDFEVVLQGNTVEVPVSGTYDAPAASWSFADRVHANPRYADLDLTVTDARRSLRGIDLDAASWHQKALIVDGEVAFVTGMNTKGTDWDTVQHAVFDPRRMAFDADVDDRLVVASEDELPDFGPRKDYGVRLQGPAVRQVEAIVRTRWQRALDAGALYSEHATPFDLSPPPSPPPGSVNVQVVTTMPPPWSERSILETHRKAIERAEGLILIEDQYFRSPLLLDSLVARMREVPDLKLVVITLPISEWDGGAKYTHLADEALRDEFPDRYLLLQLRNAELATDIGWIFDDVEMVDQDVFTHSKLRLVDDTYLSVGSCNFNNRGYKYEGELNVSVVHPPTVRQARRRVVENLVGPAWAGLVTDDPDALFDLLSAVSADNQAILDWWQAEGVELAVGEAEATWSWYRPSGFVYPLAAPDDWTWDVGPDVF